MRRPVPGPTLLLALIVVGGGFLRLARLGEADFRGDELRHYYVAESLQEGRGPLLPSGAAYRRGIDVSRLIAAVDPVVEDPELAGRLPTAIFGVVNLILFAFVAGAIGGPWAAAAAVLLLATFPEAVYQSRHVRFYTYQLNFGLIALFTGWKSVEKAARPLPLERREVRMSWLWIGLTLIAFLLAIRVQIVALTVLLAWGLCLALAGIASALRHGWADWRRNPPLQATVLALTAALLLVVARPGLVAGLARAAFAVPGWTRAGSPLTYYWGLSASFPLLVPLAPVLFVAVALRRVDLALYLLIWFGLPFCLLSFVFPFKGHRFLLLATPALFLAAGIAAATGASALSCAIRSRLPASMSGGRKRFIGAAAVALAAAAILLTMPAVSQARRFALGGSLSVLDRERWQATARLLEEQPDSRRLVLGSGDEFASLFYWGRLDFHLTAGGEMDTTLVSRATGVPRLFTPASIRSRFPSGSVALVALDSARLIDGAYDPELLSALRTEGIELCRGGCGALLLYRWALGPSGDPDRQGEPLEAGGTGAVPSHRTESPFRAWRRSPRTR